MNVSTFASRVQGWIYTVFGFITFLGFLYAAIISKFLPRSENHIVAAIQSDSIILLLLLAHQSSCGSTNQECDSHIKAVVEVPINLLGFVVPHGQLIHFPR